MRMSYPERSVVLFFFIIFVSIIIYGNGIPYVFDGNETFSSILHAKNLLTFDLLQSMGLADESGSPIAAGHPVVHTHQGNFSRLFAAVIYALGAKSPEAQIIVTTFTIGLGSIVLLFRAFRRHFTMGYVLAVMFLLMSDYVLFAQWQVVTYRVWHVAFLAAMLYAVTAHRASGNKRWLVASYFIWLGLFYYELVFAIFAAVSIGLWTLWLHRKAIWGAVTLVGCQFLGAVSGAAIVIIQLIGYLGWDGFREDLRLTYSARNAAQNLDVEGMKALLRPFFEDNNIAFFYNIVDGSQYRSVSFVIEALYTWGISTYTPALAFIVTILFCTALYSVYCPEKGFVRFANLHVIAIAIITFLIWAAPGSSFVVLFVCLLIAVYLTSSRWSPVEVQSVTWQYSTLILTGPVAASFSFFLIGHSFWHHNATQSVFSAFMEVLVIFAVSGAICGALTRFISATKKDSLNLYVVIRTALIIVFILAISRFQGVLLPSGLENTWIEASTSIVGVGLQKIGLGGIVILLVYWSLGSLRERYEGRHLSTVKEAFALFACFIGGLGAALVLFPGYVYSGYIIRYGPFLFLPITLGTAVGFYWLALGVPWARLRVAVGTSSGVRTLWRRPGEWGAALGFVFLCIFWGSVQLGNARIFPADTFANLVNAIRTLPATTTIVSNSYAIPFATVTGNWAYLDQTFATGKILRTKDGYTRAIDGDYIWFADRKTNTDYKNPSHFICFTPRTYSIVEAKMLSKGKPQNNCSQFGIVRLAEQKPDGIWPDDKIIAQDETGDNLWTIIELDQEHSPYLLEAPVARFQKADKGYQIDVSYSYEQQDGIAETSTVIELLPIRRSGSYCEVVGDAISTATGKGGKGSLFLPDGEHATSLVVAARPSTASRKGELYFTSPYRIRSSIVRRDGACTSLRLLNGNVLIGVR